MRCVYFALLLLLFFSGCVVQELSAQQRYQCADLTQPFSANIPSCATQDDCVKEVQKQLFDFPTEQLPTESRLAIASYENELARSWVYANQSKALLAEIHSLCNSSDSGALVRKANDLSHALQQTFDATDAANQSILRLMDVEERDLRESRVEQVPEENIYSTLVMLNDNWNALQSPDSSKSNTLASRWIRENQQLRQTLQSMHFRAQFIVPYTVLDAFNEFIPSGLPNRSEIAFLPFFAPLFRATFDQINEQNQWDSIVLLLNHSNSFSLFSLFNSLIGTQDSVAFDFSQLVKQDSESRSQALARGIDLERDIRQSIALSQQSLDAFHQSSRASLVELLSIELNVPKSDGLDSIALLESHRVELLNQFSKLQQERFLNRVPLGIWLSELKSIRLQSISLQDRAQSLESQSLELLVPLCADRVSQAKSYALQSNASNSLDVSNLVSRLLLEAKWFDGDVNAWKKLSHCQNALQWQQSLFDALNHRIAFEQSQNASLNDCLKSLGEWFASGNPETKPFSFSYNQLKSLPTPYKNPQEVLRQCAELQSNTIALMQQNSFIQSCQQSFRQSSEWIQWMESMQEIVFDYSLLNSLNSLREEQFALFQHFSNNQLIASDLAKPETVCGKLLDWSVRSKKTLDSVVSDVVSSHAVLKPPLDGNGSLLLSNPLPVSLGAITVRVPFAFQNPGWFSNPLVQKTVVRNGLLELNLQSLPLGATTIPFSVPLPSNSLLATNDFNALSDYFESQWSQSNQSAEWRSLGWEEEASRQDALNQQAIALRDQAVQWDALGNHSEAVATIQKAIAVFRQSIALTPLNVLSSKNQSFLLQWNSLGSLASLYSLDSNVSKFGDWNWLQQQFRQSVLLGNISNASNALHSIQSLLSDFNQSVQLQSETKALQLAEPVQQGESLMLETIPSLLSDWRDELNSISLQELTELEYVLPLSKTELDALTAQSSKIYSASLQTKTQRFLQLVDGKQFFDALRQFASMEYSFNNVVTQSNRLQERLISAKSQLKDDAKNRLDQASQSVPPTNYDVIQSKKYFSSGQFLNSLKFSTKVIQSIPSKDPLTGLQSFSLPFSVIPLIGLIALGVWWKSKNSKKPVEEKPWKKIERFEQKE